MSSHPFDTLMELKPCQVRLDCAALHLARDAYPHLWLPRYLKHLDDLADEVADQRPGLSAAGRYIAMRDVLIERHGFRGAMQNYYDPDNSFLNRVLDRRLGIPISLAIVWVEIGRRLKWPVSGVSFPTHFLVRFDDPEQFVLVDPLHDGASLSLDDCRELLHAQTDGKVEFSERMLNPVDTCAILRRLLGNLREIYRARGDWIRLIGVLERLAAVDPSNRRCVEEIAEVRFRLGDVHGACRVLEHFLCVHPTVQEKSPLRRNLARLKAALIALN
jgi:regulator of sirC expression with transglutaminase-like and TPR domain